MAILTGLGLLCYMLLGFIDIAELQVHERWCWDWGFELPMQRWLGLGRTWTLQNPPF